LANFRFTIITAFYNTGEYLKDSIESVINQDIGFEDNVQLILVDDGSSDNSKDIALSYQDLYPNNILVLSKENGGVATARNLGLKHIQGEFVNFLDSDDKFSPNSLSVIDKFLKDNDVDIAAMPLIYFDKREGDHHLNYKFEEERIIDLNEDFDYPHAHISSSFIRYDVIKNYSFNPNLVNGSDLLFMNEILIDVQKYGVTNKTHYNYRKRGDSSSIMDNAPKSKRFFTEKMKICYKHLIDLSIQ
jgi:glycosyltransferase involved in cell wall biosynthesis